MDLCSCLLCLLAYFNIGLNHILINVKKCHLKESIRVLLCKLNKQKIKWTTDLFRSIRNKFDILLKNFFESTMNTKNTCFMIKVFEYKLLLIFKKLTILSVSYFFEKSIFLVTNFDAIIDPA